MPLTMSPGRSGSRAPPSTPCARRPAMRAPLPEFRLESYFAEHEFTARHHLTASDAETLTVAELLALATPEQREAFDSLPLGYLPTWGTDALREAIAATYETIDPD